METSPPQDMEIYLLQDVETSPQDSEKTTRSSVTLRQFGNYGSLVLLAVGMGVTCVVVVIERMLQSREQVRGKNGPNGNNCLEEEEEDDWPETAA